MLRRRSAGAFLALAVLWCTLGPPGTGWAEEVPASQPTVSSLLESLRARYGTAATALQGYLLSYAIRGGSVLDATVSIAGVETRKEREYLVFELDTGIVYHEARVPAALCVARIWSDIIEPTVRRAAEMGLPAEGIGFQITYRTGPYADRADIQRQLRAERIRSVRASFYVSMSDAMQLIAERITAQGLADRSEVLIGGDPARVDLNILPAGTREAGEL